MHTVCVGTQGEDMLAPKRGGVGSGHMGGGQSSYNMEPEWMGCRLRVTKETASSRGSFLRK